MRIKRPMPDSQEASTPFKGSPMAPSQQQKGSESLISLPSTTSCSESRGSPSTGALAREQLRILRQRGDTCGRARSAARDPRPELVTLQQFPAPALTCLTTVAGPERTRARSGPGELRPRAGSSAPLPAGSGPGSAARRGKGWGLGNAREAQAGS